MNKVIYINNDGVFNINKDEIQEEFFHKLKENVLKDIIAESN